MNKTLAITAIALVAVVMGMSAVAPALAHSVSPPNFSGSGVCPDSFVQPVIIGIGVHPDHNWNGIVCTNGQGVVDDLPCMSVRTNRC